MDELHYKNQIPEDNFLNIQQRQQETNPQKRWKCWTPNHF